MGLDLSSLDTKALSEQGIVVHLESPKDGTLLFGDGEQPITITILGEDSARMRAFNRKFQDVRLERLNRGKHDVTTAAIEQEITRKLAIATVAWTEIELDGKKLECTEQAAFALYSDPRVPWIAEQLIRAGGDRSRFFKSASVT